VFVFVKGLEVARFKTIEALMVDSTRLGIAVIVRFSNSLSRFALHLPMFILKKK